MIQNYENIPTNLQELASLLAGEVAVNSNGEGSYSRRAIARLIGCSPSTAIGLISGDPEKGTKLAEMLVAEGFNLTRDEPIPDGALPAIADYFCDVTGRDYPKAKSLRKLLQRLGARTFTHKLTGWTPPSQPDAKPPSLPEQLRTLASIIEFAEDKPGQKTINEFAASQTGMELPGKVTLDEICDQYPHLTFTRGDMCHIGAFVAITYRNLYGKPPEMRNIKSVSEQGKQYYPRKAVYPIDFVPYMRNVIELGYTS